MANLLELDVMAEWIPMHEFRPHLLSQLHHSFGPSFKHAWVNEVLHKLQRTSPRCFRCNAGVDEVLLLLPSCCNPDLYAETGGMASPEAISDMASSASSSTTLPPQPTNATLTARSLHEPTPEGIHIYLAESMITSLNNIVKKDK